GRFRIHNRQDFADLSWLALSWEVSVDGVVRKRGRLPRRKTAAGQSEALTVPLPRLDWNPGEERHLTLRCVTARETPWAPRGHLVAWEQFELPAPKRRSRSAAKGKQTARPLELEQSDRKAIVSGENFAVEIDKLQARLSGLGWRGLDVLAAGPRPNTWRGPTDNDGIKAFPVLPPKPLGKWLEWGLDRIEFQATACGVRRQKNGWVHVRLDSHATALDAEDDAESHLLRFTQHITVLPEGYIRLACQLRFGSALDDMPRAGIRFDLSHGFERMEWFGRGPHESYWDRKEGAALARYAGIVDDQYHRYVVPQENGNKTDTRWLSLGRKEGEALLIAGMAPMECRVSHLDGADLYAAGHLHELRPRRETIVELDWHQRGLGTGACGPDTLPAYRIGPGLHRLDVVLVPFDPNRTEPGALARSARAAFGVPAASRKRG
ncbi:MAG: beta-galactosidase domain 4-containing protein, partial [Myxococcota bacterium]